MAAQERIVKTKPAPVRRPPADQDLRTPSGKLLKY